VLRLRTVGLRDGADEPACALIGCTGPTTDGAWRSSDDGATFCVLAASENVRKVPDEVESGAGLMLIAGCFWCAIGAFAMPGHSSPDFRASAPASEHVTDSDDTSNGESPAVESGNKPPSAFNNPT